jgi:hypothetical protein
MHRIVIGAPKVSAVSCAPGAESGWSMANPSGNSFIRGAAAAFVWPVAAIGAVLLRSGTVVTSISPRGMQMAGARGTATRKRSFAVASRWQFQLSGFLACDRAESPMGSAKGSAMGDLTNCAMMQLCR